MATATKPDAKKDGKFFNVVRRDYFGDPGKRVGSRLTKDHAEAYAKEQSGAEKASFAVEPYDTKDDEKPE